MKIRLFIPFPGWADHLANQDRATLGPIHSRARVAAILFPLVVVAGWCLSNLPESTGGKSAPMTSAVDPPHPSPRPIVKSAQKSAEPAREPTPRVDPQLETLEEKRKQTRLYGTAKVKPVYRDHDVEGARITQIQEGSFWEMLGVREGDIVIELHGEPVDNPTALVALMNALERDEHVAMRVRGTDDEVRYLEFRSPDSTRR